MAASYDIAGITLSSSLSSSIQGRETHNPFQDVAFLPQANFSASFLKKYDRGESLGTTTCLRTVVGGKQGHAPCKIPFLQQRLVIHGYYEAVTKMR